MVRLAYMESVMDPTPYPDINALLHELLENVQTILGSNFVGMYLEGSLASDAFDQASDIDFVVVTNQDISEGLFLTLQAMHDRISLLDSPWALQLEGSYFKQQALRRYDPAHALQPNIEWGPGERLKMAYHNASWVIHLSILRERGITLVGPPPQTLIDPISPTNLQHAVLSILPALAASILQEPARINGRGNQSYIVLTLCRMMYTLHHGTVASKAVAARWAQETLDRRWRPLIERALAERHNPGAATSTEDVKGTLEFILYALERSQDFAQAC